MYWYLKTGEQFNDEMIGEYKAFVYEIRNLITGQYYIGKKSLYSSKTHIVKGKKKRKLVISDYLEYYGSSKKLQEDVEKLGRDNFRREILYLCKSKAESSYLEIKTQIERGVLFDENSYNSFIGCRIHANHLKGMEK